MKPIVFFLRFRCRRRCGCLSSLLFLFTLDLESFQWYQPDSEADDSGDLDRDRLWRFFLCDELFSLAYSSSDCDDSFKKTTYQLKTTHLNLQGMWEFLSELNWIITFRMP